MSEGSGAVPEAVQVRGVSEIERAMEEPVAVVYKHSPLCGLSDIAVREVRSFMARHPAVPVYIVDVVRNRPVSQEVERRLAIRHESPQAIVLERGNVAWHGSHRAVTTGSLAGACEALRQG